MSHVMLASIFLPQNVWGWVRMEFMNTLGRAWMHPSALLQPKYQLCLKPSDIRFNFSSSGWGTISVRQ